MIEIPPIMAIILPLFGAFLTPIVAFVSWRFGVRRQVCGWFAVAIIVATFAIVASMIPAVLGEKILVYEFGRSPPLGINLVVDGLSLFMALMIAGIGSLVAIYSITHMQHHTRLDLYYTLLLLIITGMMGVVVTGDIFNLYVFLEITCISAYVLVAFERRWESIEAGIKYMIIGSLGTSFILLGITLTYGTAGSLNIADLMGKFAAVTSGAEPVPLVMVLIPALFVAGFCVKAAIVPFHAWLADAHPAAPSPISALLSGVVVSIGMYGILRVVYMMLGALTIGPILAVLGLVSVLVGVLMAFGQHDFKRMLAYHTISQQGYVLLGVGMGTAIGIQGALFHMLNISIIQALNFMCAGAVLYRAKTRNFDELGGLRKSMPVTAILFLVGAFSISGTPLFNAYASKSAIYAASASQPLYLAIAILADVLTMIFFLRAFRLVFLGTRPRHLLSVKEAPMRMLFPMCILAVLCIVLGVLPRLGFNIVGTAQEAVTNPSNYVGRVLGGV